MSEIQCLVKDRRHKKNVGEIENELDRLGARVIDDPEDERINLIIVHGNTDKPRETGDLTHEMVKQCVNEGGLYLNYTTAGGKWSSEVTGKYSGGYRELMQAFKSLDAPMSIGTLAKELKVTKREPDVLSALSILCQGYLAVHAEKQNGEWGPPEIKPALEQMGWIDLLDGEGESGIAGQLKNMSGKRDEVNDPNWWGDTFDEDDLTKKAKEEWGEASTDDWKSVRNLLRRVEPADGEESSSSRRPLTEEELATVNPATVKDAYCALAERLGGANA
jgi:hypothetical protein